MRLADRSQVPIGLLRLLESSPVARINHTRGSGISGASGIRGRCVRGRPGWRVVRELPQSAHWVAWRPPRYRRSRTWRFAWEVGAATTRGAQQWPRRPRRPAQNRHESTRRRARHRPTSRASPRSARLYRALEVPLELPECSAWVARVGFVAQASVPARGWRQPWGLSTRSGLSIQPARPRGQPMQVHK